jgi:hypothetical protein
VTLEGAVTAVRSPGRAPQPQRPDLGFFIFRTFFFKFLFFFFLDFLDFICSKVFGKSF